MVSRSNLVIGGIVALIACLCVAAVAQANPNNGITPANVYFGKVVSGQHPTRMVTVRNPKSYGMSILFRRYTVAGSGGTKFTLVGHDSTGAEATCHLGIILKPGASCTLVYRVKTTKPEWWQSVVDVWYSATNGGAILGQINGAVYAHVVAP